MVTFSECGKRYGSVIALGSVSCSIEAGSFVALVGASGSGKSTLLKMINALAEPSSGAVAVAGEDVSTLPPAQLRRRIGYVFQGIGLFPHMNVGENIAIGPRLHGEQLPETRIAELLSGVELKPAMTARMPDELSGGQRQRVGVARALANDPQLLLMDEVMDQGEIVSDETPAALLSGNGGDVAQGLVAVPRAQAEKLAKIERAPQA